MTRPPKDSHCSYCGTAFPGPAGWPRTCPGCGQVTYRNPLPVAVALLPVRDSGTVTAGLVVVRRAIEPRSGMLALPGGFVDHGETWQQAVTRELAEETGIAADPADVRLADAHSDPAGGFVILFGALPERDARDLPPASPTAETDGWQIITEPTELAFPLHTLMARRALDGLRPPTRPAPAPGGPPLSTPPARPPHGPPSAGP